jgi:hypothetical protein
MMILINVFELGEGGDFHHPEASGLMQRTELSLITNVSAEH